MIGHRNGNRGAASALPASHGVLRGAARSIRAGVRNAATARTSGRERYQEARFYLFIDDTDESIPPCCRSTRAISCGSTSPPTTWGRTCCSTRAAGHEGLVPPTRRRGARHHRRLRAVGRDHLLVVPARGRDHRETTAIRSTIPTATQLDTIACGDKQFETDTDNLCAQRRNQPQLRGRHHQRRRFPL